MSMSINDLKEALDEAELEYSLHDRLENRISLAIGTAKYNDKRSNEKGFVLHLDLEEPIWQDSSERTYTSEEIASYISKIGDSNSIKLSDITSLYDQQVPPHEKQYNSIEFIVGPVNPGNATTREQKLNLLNAVNSTIKYSKFYLDRDEDIMFLYQVPLINSGDENTEMKLSGKFIYRVISALIASFDAIAEKSLEFSSGETESEESMSSNDRTSAIINKLGRMPNEALLKLAMLLSKEMEFSMDEIDDTKDLSIKIDELFGEIETKSEFEGKWNKLMKLLAKELDDE